MTTNMRIRLTILLMFVSVALAAQSGGGYFFDQGNAAYRDGDYNKAAEWYTRILDSGYEGSVVHYNLANCYYKLDELGLSILHYEKALKLSPGDPEIRQNLNLANLNVKDRIEMPPAFFLLRWWESLKTALTPSGWGKTLILFYVLAMLLATAALFLRGNALRRWLWGGMTVAGTLALLATLLMFIRMDQETNHPAGVILVNQVTVLSAPDPNSTDVFVLHEGSRLTVEQFRGEWLQIRLPDGKSGWMKRENVGVI